MSDVMVMDGFSEFDALLASVLQERVSTDAPRGLEQRLLARLAQENERFEARPFAFAENIAVHRSATSTYIAVGAHAAVVLGLLGFVAHQVHVAPPVRQLSVLTMTVPPPPAPPKMSSIGGGGGQHDVAPVIQGRPPKFASEQLVPPKAPPTIASKLSAEPSVVVQPDIQMAANTMPRIGIPSSSLKGVSLGNGAGTGLGSGSGAGIGSGYGSNVGGAVLHIGGSVKAPMIISQVDPEFSEEARKAKFSGNVEVYLIVDENGNPSHIRVARSVGMGLDEKAVEAVRQYKFKPAMQNGKPVKVDLYIDVNFTIF